MEDFNSSLVLENLPHAFAYHKMMFNSHDQPIDYVFLYVNDAFEVMTGLSKDDILYKKVSEVLPNLDSDAFDWVKMYGKVVVEKQTLQFRQYSTPLNKWYDVVAYANDDDCFTTIFHEVTQDVSKNEALQKIVSFLHHGLKSDSVNIDFQRIVDTMLAIAQVEFCAINIVNKDKQDNTLMAYASKKQPHAQRKEELDNNLLNSVWPNDVFKQPSLNEFGYAFFDSFSVISALFYDKDKIQQLQQNFNIHKICVLVLTYQSKNIGFLTLALHEHQYVQHLEHVLLFVDLLKEYIPRMQIEATLKETRNELEKFFNLNLDMFAITDQKGYFKKLNPAWEQTLGYSLEELLSQPYENFLHKDDLNKTTDVVTSLKDQHQVRGFVNRFVDKQGNIHHIEWRTQPQGHLWYSAARDITHSIQQENKLAFEHQQMLSIFDEMNALIYVVDIKTYEILFINQYGKKIYGDVVTKPCYQTLGRSNNGPCSFCKIAELEKDNDKKIEWNRFRQDINRHFMCNDSMIQWPDGNQVKLHVAYDISDNITMQNQLKQEKQRYMTTLMSVSDGVIACDTDGIITIINPVALTLLKTTESEVLYKEFHQVVILVDEADRFRISSPLKQVLESKTAYSTPLATQLLNKDGQFIDVDVDASPIFNNEQTLSGIVVVISDITEKRKQLKEVEYLSFHDQLTGLYNRRYMEDALYRLNVARNLPLSIMAIDLNGLKLTNDAFGHQAGDKLLQKVAQILKQSCRSDDIIARSGGDEFVIILPKTSAQEVIGIKDRMLMLASDATMDSVVLSLAIGLATKEKKQQSISEVMRLADNNMYKDKLKRGKIMRSKTIEVLLTNINMKYDNEQIHTERVAQYCEAIAKAMNLKQRDIEDVKVLGILHDIGKIIIPPDILNKKEPLTQEEWTQIKQHPITGYNILKNVEEYASIAEAVLYHHERIDGTGYPSRLKGKKIPLFSRIIAVADAYEAMTAKRAYHTPKSKEEAIAELRSCANTQFDAEIVEIFITHVL